MKWAKELCDSFGVGQTHSYFTNLLMLLLSVRVDLEVKAREFVVIAVVAHLVVISVRAELGVVVVWGGGKWGILTP